jgi:hypothetical protein
MDRKVRWFCALLFIAFLLWIALTSPRLYECVYAQSKYYSDSTIQENIASFYHLVVGSRACIGDFISANGEAVIAFFTIVLAIATILLWIVTQGILSDARRTSEKQLRAYVFLNDIRLLNGTSIKLAGSLSNAGQTPAHNVVCIIGWAVNKPSFDKFTEPKVTPKDSRAVIGPHKENTIHFEIDGFTRKDLLKTGETIFVWAKISYEDVFGNNQKTLVRTYMKTLTAKGEISFAISDEGNEAT